MIKTLIFYTQSLLILVFIPNLLVANDFSVIRSQLMDEILAESVGKNNIDLLITTLKDEGYWPDIDYQDVSRTAFRHGEHLRNLRDMSLAFAKTGSEFYQSEKLKLAINKSLNYWLKHDFICDNWWWNQIGTPRYLIDVMLLLGKNNLTERQINKLLPIVGRANLDASGARPSGDRIKIAGLLAKKLIFLDDKDRFAEVIDVIENEIKFATGRGMQYDFSFHHRVDRVNNTLSYGIGYAQAFAEWASLVAGTRYAFAEQKINQLVDYFLDGITKMMVFGKYPDIAAKNRSISRVSSLSAFSTYIPEKLIKTTKYRKAELQEIIRNSQQPKYSQSTFSKFFWHAEYYSHQRPGYFTSVRMYSTRNRSMEEPYNAEGLKNHYLGDGANYVYNQGNEYFNIFPVFDWQKIPGTTTVLKQSHPDSEQIQQEGKSKFVGGVTDGTFGFAAFNFNSPLDDLAAKKAWFFFEEEYMCLGAGITSNDNAEVVTTLNQALLDGEVTIEDKIMEKGIHTLQNVSWIHHDGIAYIFPHKNNMQLENTSKSGSWFDINQQSDTPKSSKTKEVFLLYLSHGSQPNNDSYAYVVKPNASISQLPDYYQKMPIEIIQNDANVQAVKHHKLALVQIVFHKKGTVKLNDNLSLSSDSAGLVMVKLEDDEITKMTVADPSRELIAMNIELNQSIDFEDERLQLKKKGDLFSLSIALPRGVYAGKSVVLQ